MFEIKHFGKLQKHDGYIYDLCGRDGYGILVSNCESGDCSHWIKQFQNAREIILRNENFDTLHFQLTYFDYSKVLNAKKEIVTSPYCGKSQYDFLSRFLAVKA